MAGQPAGVPATILDHGRAKAYRPIPAAERRAALAAALAAWRRDDWFEAHEVLEPAWMGADDPDERDLYSGLIKLAAAYVHRARGNAAGMAKNLGGAETRLARVASRHERFQGVAVGPLLVEVRSRLATAGGRADLAVPPPPIVTEEDS